jgi:2-polyprenyl-6-methoxyphenol hydroxylase-like FAD-dependent oxidoreductase
VVRGVARVEVTAGGAPEARFAVADEEVTAQARLVVGADGRSSAVRRQLGVELSSSGVRSFGVGVLVEDLHDWPAGVNAVGTDQDVHFLVFPRQEGRARIYLIFDKQDPRASPAPAAASASWTGWAPCGASPNRSCSGGPGRYPAGPASRWTTPGRTGRTSRAPCSSATQPGYNDPVIGQGLSIALRDTRIVAEILTGGDDWSPQAFAPYGQERAERMRRLRATAEAGTRLRVDFTERGRLQRKAAFARFAADPAARLPIAAALVGPEVLPAEAFERSAADRMLALA